MIKTFIIFIALISGGAKEVKVSTEASTIMWTCSKVIGKSHQGVLTLKDGSLDIANGKLSGGSFVVDMYSLVCTDLEGEWKEKLEGHLRSDDFFSVETYPTAEFEITKVSPTAADTYEVVGDVTIKGTTEQITFSATMKKKDGAFEAFASITIDRSKFDVRYGSGSFFDNLGDNAINDEFTLEVKLVAGDE